MKGYNYKFKYALIICIVIIVLYLFFYNRTILTYTGMGHFRKHISMRYLKDYILSYGNFAVVVFIIIYSLKPVVLVIPTSLLSILAGNIFGPMYAFVLSMIGCFFSASLAFFLAHMLGKPFVDKILRGKIFKLDNRIEKHGFLIMLLMRLSFVFPYDPLSYAAGLTKMRYTDFILGTMLGIIPEMLSYSFMGKHLNRPFSVKMLIPIAAMLGVAFTASYIYRRYKKIKTN
ncbi:MAG: TVP38/TMEM64 family protein [Clostridium sp.]|uniref:TVP38/TMEM64 family protein n=1 Tax=Clostridium sp. TaxID=1506 RepID=UPI0039ED5696